MKKSHQILQKKFKKQEIKMDINEIKKLIKSENDKVIIVDANGNPEFIITAYPEANIDNQISEFADNQSAQNNQNTKDQTGRLTIDDLPYL